MVKLRNIGPDAVSLYRPEGAAGALTVEPGQLAEVQGELAQDQPLDDAIVVEHNGEPRLFSTSRWELELAGKPKTAGVKPVTDASNSEG